MLRRDERPIHIRAAVAEKLPGSTYFRNLFKIEVGGQYLVLIARSLGKDLAARIGEVAGSVELADVPRRFCANAINGGNKVSVWPGK